MIDQSSMRLIGGGAAIALVAALGGYAVSRSAAPPLATEAPVADKTEARTDELRLSQEAFASTGIMVETVAAGGLSGGRGSNSSAQAAG
jgi:cobalt-zinc-cadmium efflux system membrane fusion protein